MAEGCLCLWEDQVIHVPGFQVDVVDTTGAGDAFHGAFLYGLLQGWELERMAIFANTVAAINCTRLGGRAGLPSLFEVETSDREWREGMGLEDEVPGTWKNLLHIGGTKMRQMSCICNGNEI